MWEKHTISGFWFEDIFSLLFSLNFAKRGRSIFRLFTYCLTINQRNSELFVILFETIILELI